MPLRKLVERLTRPVEDHDRDKLIEFCDARAGCAHIDDLEPRSLARVVGEVSSVRVVPRAGAPSLEVTVTDGRGNLVAVFFGRRHLAGLHPGRRLVVEGVVAESGNRALVFNPVYELLA
ncbi:MAG: OB-fold nucleic acid binding domain-containing protein [Acidimicrobiia bacterium]